MSAKETIEKTIHDNKIVIFMKGTPAQPQCGFSAAAIRCLQDAGATFASVDVLADPAIRDEVKVYSNWPTIPQIYMKGEFVGGCDIIRELHASGELKTMVAGAMS